MQWVLWSKGIIIECFYLKWKFKTKFDFCFSSRNSTFLRGTLCPEYPKRDQNPKFTPLSETTSVPVCFIWGFPPPPGSNFHLISSRSLGQSPQLWSGREQIEGKECSLGYSADVRGGGRLRDEPKERLRRRLVLYQLSYQANWELVMTLWIRKIPVDGDEDTQLQQ